MTVSNYSKIRQIPSKITTKKSAPTTTNFARGIFTYKPNDTMSYDEAYLIQNGRFDRIGEYKTRTGLSPLCRPIGYSPFRTNIVPGSIEMKPLNEAFFAITSTIVPTPSEPLYSIEAYISAKTSETTGVIRCLLVNINDPEQIIAESCASVTSTTPTLKEFIFKDGINIQECEIKFVSQTGEFLIGCQPTTTETALNIYEATSGKVISLFEANIDGVITIIFAFQTEDAQHTETVTLYRMSAAGEITPMRQLPSGVKNVRFAQNLNQIRYTDGVEGPRLINPVDWSDSPIPTEDLETDVDLQIKTSNILPGPEDNMIYFDAETTTQAVWTYPYGYMFAHDPEFETSATLNKWESDDQIITTTIQKSTLTAVSDVYPVSSLVIGDWIVDPSDTYGIVSEINGDSLVITAQPNITYPINSYDKFDRDFRQNFPAIKTGDPLTAMFNLGGVVYFLTRRNKYYLYMQSADVYTPNTSSAQHGTFSQESCVCDLNYAYYANDDGVYIFDGSSEASITQNTIQNTYDMIINKESITLELYNNRLYVFYSSKPNGKNDSCLVYNINLKLWESFDTGIPVTATIGRQTVSNRLICGSGHYGQLFTYENQNAPYADCGAPINFDIETAYLHFGTPSQLHRITKWRPEFAKVEGNYTIKCGYALDFTDDVKYAFSINLHNGTILNEHTVWDDPRNYGQPVMPTKLTTIPQVNGQFRRCQIRYQHHAAFEPVNFKSHTLCVETQRVR